MTRWLFRLDVGVTDDLAPLNTVALHALGKVVWRACNRKDEARLQHALAGLRIFEDATRFGFPSATSSMSDFAGTDGFTISACGLMPRPVIGAKSLSGSYGSLP